MATHFGKLLRELRLRKKLGLRQFCKEFGHSASNWSKFERGLIQPPVNGDILRRWAEQLDLQEGTSEWFRFFDYAAVDAGRLPAYLERDGNKKAQVLAYLEEITPGKSGTGDDLEVWHL